MIAVKRTNAVSSDTALPLNGQHLLPYFLSLLMTTSARELKLEDLEDGIYPLIGGECEMVPSVFSDGRTGGDTRGLVLWCE